MGSGVYQRHLKYKVRICCNFRNASVSFGGTLFDRLCEWKSNVEKTIAGECLYTMSVYKSVYAGVNEDERTLCIKITCQDARLTRHGVVFDFNSKRALINNMSGMDILKEYEGEYIIYEKGIGFNVNDASSSIVIGVKKKDRHEIVRHPRAMIAHKGSVKEYIDKDIAETEELFERYQKVEPVNEEEESLLGKPTAVDDEYPLHIERILRKTYERFIPTNVLEATKELVKNLGGN